MKSQDKIIKILAKRYNCDPSVFKQLQLKNEEQNRSIIPEIPSVILMHLEIENS